jgi:EF hand domain-containing protein
MRRTNIVLIILVIAVLIATWALPGTAVAQRQSVPKPQDKLALGEDEVKQLLLLMDTDKNGRVSRHEFMKFMEAEFDRLDKDKSGDLDVKGISAIAIECEQLLEGGEVTPSVLFASAISLRAPQCTRWPVPKRSKTPSRAI